jgi:hypothetical protein
MAHSGVRNNVICESLYLNQKLVCYFKYHNLNYRSLLYVVGIILCMCLGESNKKITQLSKNYLEGL